MSKLERYNYEEAYNESAKMREKIDGGAANYDEAEKLVEKEKLGEAETELSPEVIEMIMAKVQDIDKEGTAFNALRRYQKDLGSEEETLKSIFKLGFMGTRGMDKYSDFDKNKYREKLLEKKVGAEFNIIGRSRRYNAGGSMRQVLRSEWTSSSETGYVFLFDIGSFKEVDNKGELSVGRPLYNSRGKRSVLEHGQYTAQDGSRIGEPADDEFGFYLSGRMAPRYFRGLVIYARKDLAMSEEIPKIITECMKSNIVCEQRLGATKEQIVYRTYGIPIGRELLKREKEDDGVVLKDIRDAIGYRLLNKIDWASVDEKFFKILLDRAASSMKEAYKDKLNLMIPIYNHNGDLVWPRKMSYEEVKNFVKERDKDKK